MSVILVLVTFSILVALVFLFVFFWSVRDGQYDDPYSSSVRILFEDEKPADPPAEASEPAKGLAEKSSNQ
jgi:cbb3-type cytochrome oxidase maturation protein